MSPQAEPEMLDQLVDLLDRVVREQVGESLAQTMQRIRRLAVERRAGLPQAESRLIAELQHLSDSDFAPSSAGSASTSIWLT